MSIKVVWDNEEKTIVRYVFDARWTWDEFYVARAEAYRQIDSVQHRVGVIFDTPPNIGLPSNMITHSKSAVNKTHSNTIVVVVVAQNMYLRTMLTMVMKLSKKAGVMMRLASSLEEARMIVHQRLREAEMLPSV